MLPMAGTAAVSNIAQVLADKFEVDPDLIEELVKALNAGLDNLPKKIAPIEGTSFSRFPRGEELGFHTNNAREVMIGTYKELETLLTDYQIGVKEVRRVAEQTDEDSAAQIRAVAGSINRTNDTRGIPDSTRDSSGGGTA